MRPRGVLRLVLVTVLLSVLLGCGHGPGGTEGDCSTRISFESITYRADNRLAPAPSARDSELAGDGDLVGCEGEPVGQTKVHAIEGVDPSIAIAILRPPSRAGIYVAEGVKRTQWPDQIRALKDAQN